MELPPLMSISSPYVGHVGRLWPNWASGLPGREWTGHGIAAGDVPTDKAPTNRSKSPKVQTAKPSIDLSKLLEC